MTCYGPVMLMGAVTVYALRMCVCAYSDQIDLLLLRLAAAIKKITGKDE